jgi:hypothetical protein
VSPVVHEITLEIMPPNEVRGPKIQLLAPTSYRNVAFLPNNDFGPHSDNAVSRDLAAKTHDLPAVPALMACSLCRRQEKRMMRVAEDYISVKHSDSVRVE